MKAMKASSKVTVLLGLAEYQVKSRLASSKVTVTLGALEVEVSQLAPEKEAAQRQM